MKYKLLILILSLSTILFFSQCKDDKDNKEPDPEEIHDPSDPDNSDNPDNPDDPGTNNEGDDSDEDPNQEPEPEPEPDPEPQPQPDEDEFVAVDINDPFDNDGITKAFPGAEGGAKYVTGGRGGKVLHVTSLSDEDKQGTLRWALKQSYPRIIVFDVSGTIELTKRLDIKYDDVTIAGQTAPGDGICIKNYSTYVGANNVIIRFLRFRMGDEKATEDDAIWGRNQKDIIIDHCSMSWSTDECASFYNNENFTMQWCILGESLKNSVHGKGSHGYGGIWGGTAATFHHNVILHHDSRNPRLCGPRFRTGCPVADETVDIRNNVFYNWGKQCGYAGEGGRYNFVNNYYKPGPATTGSTSRFFQPYAYEYTSSSSGNMELKNGSIGLFYASGNYFSGRGANYDFKGIKDFKPQNNTVFYRTTQNGDQEECSSMNESTMRTNTMFEIGSMAEVSTHTAEDAYTLSVKYAGASLHRDRVDARYAREVLAKSSTYAGSNGSTGGIIDSQTDVGGYPVYNSKTKPVDTDNDGMPDAWELVNGLNPEDASDAIQNSIDSRYNNIEVYINSIVLNIMKCTAVVSDSEQ
ncbi:MAG: pectate lyase [Bacteroidales bacterium]|nr:pectate lyase [Bacteroidales bacterium]